MKWRSTFYFWIKTLQSFIVSTFSYFTSYLLGQLLYWDDVYLFKRSKKRRWSHSSIILKNKNSNASAKKTFSHLMEKLCNLIDWETLSRSVKAKIVYTHVMKIKMKNYEINSEMKIWYIYFRMIYQLMIK